MHKATLDSFHRYKRKLPHWDVPGAITYLTFVTYRRKALNSDEQRIILETVLSSREICCIQVVVMPDHLHLVLKAMMGVGNKHYSMAEIAKRLKARAAVSINRMRSITGKSVWGGERYDRVIRNDTELKNTLSYNFWNPVAAGLCDKPEDYPFHRCIYPDDSIR